MDKTLSKEFAAKFAANLASAEGVVEGKQADAAKAGVNVQAFAGLGSITDTYCNLWPTINGGIKSALRLLDWVNKPLAVQIRAWLQTYKQVVHPLLCDKPVKDDE